MRIVMRIVDKGLSTHQDLTTAFFWLLKEALPWTWN